MLMVLADGMIAAIEKGPFGTVPVDSSTYKITSVFG
jgi:hypothetical protein